MFSYAFMKFLESRPHRYDAGIRFFSAGHASRVKKQIVAAWIRPGDKVLDIGCGTGELLSLALEKCATAVGTDASAPMLAQAEKRFAQTPPASRPELIHARVTDLDALPGNAPFDVVVSTLAFSELYSLEQRFALSQAGRLLKKSGTLILADEARPQTALQRLIHFAARLPQALLAFLISRPGRAPWPTRPP